MGLFDLFKKHNNHPTPVANYKVDDNLSATKEGVNNLEQEVLEELVGAVAMAEDGKNEPSLLTAKLFYENIPAIDEPILFKELRSKYPDFNLTTGDNILLFSFPDIKHGENAISTQYCLMTTNDLKKQPLPQQAFRQNWHWKEAGQTTNKCKYEILLVERQIAALNYKQRAAVFIDFVSAIIKATDPLVVYCKNAEKLLDPKDVLDCHTSTDPDIHPLTNIRLFKVEDSTAGQMIMDTIGLNALGLPDFEILFSHDNPAKIAELLLRYCYFIYDIGDNILHGEYLDGLNEDEKWRCEKRLSILQPYRIVLHLTVT